MYSLINCFCLFLVVVSSVRGTGQNEKIPDKLKLMIKNKMNQISKNNVAASLSAVDLFGATSNITEGDTDIVPASTCPNFSDVMKRLQATITETTLVINEALEIINNMIPGVDCNEDRSQFASLKCFLRAFAQSYNELSTLLVHANNLKTEMNNLISDYNMYSTKCNTKWNFKDTLQLMELIQFTTGKITNNN